MIDHRKLIDPLILTRKPALLFVFCTIYIRQVNESPKMDHFCSKCGKNGQIGEKAKKMTIFGTSINLMGIYCAKY